MCQPGRPGVLMPAGDGQAGSPGFEGFHKHEVPRVFLVRRDFDAGAGDHLVERALRQPRRSPAIEGTLNSTLSSAT